MSNSRYRKNNYYGNEKKEKAEDKIEEVKVVDDTSTEVSDDASAQQIDSKILKKGVVVNTSLLNIRATPEINKKNVLYLMSKSDIVTINCDFIDDTWYFIEYTDEKGVTCTGYVMKYYIKIVEE